VPAPVYEDTHFEFAHLFCLLATSASRNRLRFQTSAKEELPRSNGFRNHLLN